MSRYSSGKKTTSTSGASGLSCSCNSSSFQTKKCCSMCSSSSSSSTSSSYSSVSKTSCNKSKCSGTSSYMTTTNNLEDGIESTIGSKLFHAVDEIVDIALSQANNNHHHQLDTKYTSGSSSCSQATNGPYDPKRQKSLNTTYVSGSSACSQATSVPYDPKRQKSLNTTYISGSSACSPSSATSNNDCSSSSSHNYYEQQSTSCNNQGLPSCLFGRKTSASIDTAYVSGSSEVKSSSNLSSKFQSKSQWSGAVKSINQSSKSNVIGGKIKNRANNRRKSAHK